jgi:hypothetical protein
LGPPLKVVSLGTTPRGTSEFLAQQCTKASNYCCCWRCRVKQAVKLNRLRRSTFQSMEHASLQTPHYRHSLYMAWSIQYTINTRARCFVWKLLTGASVHFRVLNCVMRVFARPRLRSSIHFTLAELLRTYVCICAM